MVKKIICTNNDGSYYFEGDIISEENGNIKGIIRNPFCEERDYYLSGQLGTDKNGDRVIRLKKESLMVEDQETLFLYFDNESNMYRGFYRDYFGCEDEISSMVLAHNEIEAVALAKEEEIRYISNLFETSVKSAGKVLVK